MKRCWFLMLVFLGMCSVFASGAEVIGRQTAPDAKVAWYFPGWLDKSPYSPTFQVRDTENKYGRYTKETKTITIKYINQNANPLTAKTTLLKCNFCRSSDCNNNYFINTTDQTLLNTNQHSKYSMVHYLL